MSPKLTYMTAPYIQRNEMARNVVMTANIASGMEKMTSKGGNIKRSGLNHKRLILGYIKAKARHESVQAWSEWVFSIFGLLNLVVEAVGASWSAINLHLAQGNCPQISDRKL